MGRFPYITHPFATKVYRYTSVRLACVMATSSVSPEPRSNSQNEYRASHLLSRFFNHFINLY